tara:strand:+ start:9075 stop:10016 length:942 start_codon:yes stop_codon:yes gene_type:complete
MRYKIQKTKNFTGATTGVKIIDNETGQVVKNYSISSYLGGGVSRKQAVGQMNRDAEAELNTLQSSAFTSDITGESYGSEEDLQAAERRFELEEGVEKFEGRITEAGRIREDLAENIQARQQGQLLSQLQRSILGTGGDISQVSALTPQVQEAGQRSLQDYIAQSQARTQQQLAEFVPTEIGAEYNLANLEDAMKRFTIGEETERAQIQAGLDAQPEWWESIIGSAGSAAGTAAGTALVTKALPYLASLSDKNSKENISQVGILDNGLPVYLFNYKGNNTPQIGLMAQDVEKVNKDAVTEIDGIKHVYYTKAVK